MRKTVAGIVLAATMAVGAGVALAQPVSAQEDDRSERIQERLDELVQDGVISDERAEAILDRIAERAQHHEDKRAAREARAQGIADTLGITVDDLIAARDEGTSLAELAATAGVDVQQIIDQLVAEATGQIEEALNDGQIDEARAAARIEALTERITARVNGEVPDHRPHRMGRRFGPRRHFRGQLPDNFEPDNFFEHFRDHFVPRPDSGD